ncbi:MAG: bifunctional homocysteine S-methyltransferase/methylenetetrahydrofolate reductase [Planctomycetota bacterium]
MRDFLKAIAERPQVFDGAMGTMLYESGVFINTCYDELCLTRPELVRDIHRRYVEAGVDVIGTNSFGANRFKLGAFGLSSSTEAINTAAAESARAEAGEDVFVAASVGPCSSAGKVLADEAIAEARSAFAEQITALAAGGADLILLETFSDLRELQAAAAVARASGLPVAASFAVNEHGETTAGAPADAMAEGLDRDPNVDIIGLNCGTGPAGAYDALQAVLRVTDKPVHVAPNAGFPREVGGRLLYLVSPEYFTEYAKRFIEIGARGVGGCCGTTPDHIRTAAKAVKSLSGVKRHVEVVAREREEVAAEVIPTAEKSKLGAKLAAGQLVTSVELLPPRSSDTTKLVAKARRCAEAGVDAINIPDGPRASARISPMIAALTIEREAGIETVLHYCCRDRNLIGMQSDLLGGYAAGLHNWLIITGDPPKLGEYPDATGVFDVDAIGLTRMAANLNRGVDLAGAPIDPPTGILIGVGANPCAVEMRREIDRYFRKLDAGAEFAITQPIFDPDALRRFCDEVAAYPLQIPIIAGVWPLLSYKNAEFMNNEVPGVIVPQAALERMSRCTTKEDGRRVGIDIARETMTTIAPYVRGFQVSAPLGNVDIALDVLATGSPPFRPTSGAKTE